MRQVARSGFRPLARPSPSALRQRLRKIRLGPVARARLCWDGAHRPRRNADVRSSLRVFPLRRAYDHPGSLSIYRENAHYVSFTSTNTSVSPCH